MKTDQIKFQSAQASPTGKFFSFAWKSIWSGKFSRILRLLEIIFWTFLAVVIGGWVFTYHGFNHFNQMFNLSYWTLVILTPILIGPFVYRVNTETRESAMILNTTPLRPHQILLPRMAAVLLSWFRVLLPLIILFVVTHELCYMNDIPDTFERWLRTAWWQAMVFPYEGASCWRYPEIFFESYFPLSRLDNPLILLKDKLPIGWSLMVLFWGYSRMLGWILLPVSWGFCILSVVKKKPALYLYFYLLYLLVLFVVMYFDRIQIWKYSIFNYEFDFPHIMHSYLYLLTSPLALLLAIIVYNVTLDLMERRAN